MSAASSVVISALDADQVKTYPYIGIIAVVVVGLLLLKFLSSLIMRIVILVVVVTVGSSLWVQRDKAINKINEVTKRCDATFFGIHVDSTDANVKKACELAARIPKPKPTK